MLHELGDLLLPVENAHIVQGGSKSIVFREKVLATL